MMRSHSYQFKVQTLLPQLANRAIRQILVELVELKKINPVEPNRQYSALGLIRREIRYTEPDGRIRKIDDQFQFEVMLGELEPDPVALGQTELRQDYFVFQPQPPGNGPPTLEQGLTLTFWANADAVTQAAKVANWWFNRIVKQGSISRLCNFAVSFPENGANPIECMTQFVLEPATSQAALLSGAFKGTLVYVGRCGYQTLQFEQTASFLVTELPAKRDGDVVFIAQVRDVSWRLGDLSRNEWRFEAILEFKWHLIKPTALACVDGSTAVGLPVVKLMTAQPLARQQLRFDQTITLATTEKSLTELKVALQGQKEEWTKKGLLLTASLNVEVFYVRSTGVEAYQQWTVDCHELVKTADLPSGVDSTAQLNTTVKIAVEKYDFLGGKLRVELILAYDCCFGQTRLVEVVRDPDSTCKVLARVQTATKVFTTFDQAEFVLRKRPVRIDEVKAVLAQVICIPQTGKVNAQGQQEVWVTYYDSEHRQRTDLFHHSWQASFIWDAIDPTLAIDCQAKLAFDRYTAAGEKILYQDLWELQLAATRLQEVPIALGQAQPSVLCNPANGNDGAVRNVRSVCFRLEREIRLDFGIPKAIVGDRTGMGLFCCRQAGQAILVSGRIDSELEYWDRGGVLRQECQELPFWQFVSLPRGSAAYSVAPLLQPQIRKCVYQPLGTWPWAKGRMKLLVEVELQMMGGDSEPNENPDAKSDRSGDGGSR